MVDVDVLKAQLVRHDATQSWGFRLHGGVDLTTPLTIARVSAGSAAAKIGLQPGDEVVEIADTSTASLTHQQALDLVDSHTDTLLMTVERKVLGNSHSAPSHNILHSSSATIQPMVKNYQPMDMTGSSRPPTHVSHTQVLPIFDYLTVQARPFESHRQKPAAIVYAEQQQQQQQPTASHYQPTQHYYPSYNNGSPVCEHSEDWSGPQSRTFRMLQSVMHNEEPAAGVSGLPPPRSATMEHWRHQQQQQQAAGGQRVKVFMPQQYNSPMGMYSAHNVLETFTTQAESLLHNMDRCNVQQSGDEFAPVYSNN